ncbi:MAG: High-affinity proline transporter PutP [Chlamydiae bacterium]|nr:High-affinity proline transporter PutP [Chlamydiota bacterium]
MTADIFLEALAILIYFGLLISVAVVSYKKQRSDTDFIIGNRTMNFWMTAMAAHASDMSNWLFMAYPGTIFILGIHQAWAAIGLWVFFLLSWQFIAPKVRTATEQYNSLTFSSFFESRLSDLSGVIRVFTAVMLFVFYTIYMSAALVGMGFVLNTLFGIPYNISVIIGILIVIPYVFVGGYLTLAWIDLFQGIFLLIVIVFVPLYLLPLVGGFSGIWETLSNQGLSTSLIPNFQFKTIAEIILLTAGWGLGYFGAPHIITKFMGIKNISEIGKSKLVGMTWMFFALAGATLVGLVGVSFFKSGGLTIAPEVFIEMVKQSFPPFAIGFILCAVFAATINAMSSMVLVVSSSLTEDIYKKLFRKDAGPKELLLVSRMSVIVVALIAFTIAIAQISTIYELVLYAWSGLGASFGPLLLLCLYMRGITKYGAWAGILTGGILSAIWPLFNRHLPIDIPPLPPAFLLSILSIWIISKMTAHKIDETNSTS